MNLDHDFVQVWKFSEDQKKNANRTLFLPRIQVKTKKKVFSKIKRFFSPILGEDQKKKKKENLQHEKNTFFSIFTLSCTPFQIDGVCSAYHTSVEIRALFYVTMLQITEHVVFNQL